MLLFTVRSIAFFLITWYQNLGKNLNTSITVLFRSYVCNIKLHQNGKRCLQKIEIEVLNIIKIREFLENYQRQIYTSYITSNKIICTFHYVEYNIGCYSKNFSWLALNMTSVPYTFVYLSTNEDYFTGNVFVKIVFL